MQSHRLDFLHAIIQSADALEHVVSPYLRPIVILCCVVYATAADPPSQPHTRGLHSALPAVNQPGKITASAEYKIISLHECVKN